MLDGDITKANRYRGGSLGRRAMRQLAAPGGANSRLFPSKREFFRLHSKCTVLVPRIVRPINPLPGNSRCRPNGNLFPP